MSLLAFLLLAQDMPQVKPGPQHEILKSFEGTWEATIKMFQDPSQPPAEARGVETDAVGCGGLWLIFDFKGEMGGQPFTGHGILGYDEKKKKYVGAWIDSVSATIDLSEGSYDEKAKSLTMLTESVGPSGKR